jgi:hypothetical protein
MISEELQVSEANAVGSEMLRADLLHGADAALVRKLPGVYLSQRIQLYLDEDDVRRMEIIWKQRNCGPTCVALAEGASVIPARHCKCIGRNPGKHPGTRKLELDSRTGNCDTVHDRCSCIGV